jgi:hypothetical protein
MLKTDHQRVRELFQTYEHSHDPHLRQQMASLVCVALELYALLEDTVFSPAVAEETEEEGATLDERAREEHHRIMGLVAELRSCAPDDAVFDARFHELMDSVSQHIHTEEHTILPKAEEQRSAAMEQRKDAMQELKQETTGASSVRSTSLSTRVSK